MDKHECGRLPPRASTGQARLEKLIERTRNRNHCNNCEARQILSGNRKASCRWYESRASISGGRSAFCRDRCSLQSLARQSGGERGRRYQAILVTEPQFLREIGPLHLQDLGFLVFEMIVDRLNEAISELLNFVLRIAKAVFGQLAGGL
jgi:hypothetical protein